MGLVKKKNDSKMKHCIERSVRTESLGKTTLYKKKRFGIEDLCHLSLLYPSTLLSCAEYLGAIFGNYGVWKSQFFKHF